MRLPMAAASWAVGQSPAADSTRPVMTTSIPGRLEPPGQAQGAVQAADGGGLEHGAPHREAVRVEGVPQRRDGFVQGQGERGHGLEARQHRPVGVPQGLFE